MNQSSDLKMPHNGPAVNGFPLKIIHPVHDHASESLKAFAHALALAYASRGEIEILDIRNGSEHGWTPSVRAMLEHWGILPPNSERSDVKKIGLWVTKIIKNGKPKKVIAGRLEKHRHDLLVIGTHERHGLGVLFGQDLAAYLADEFRQTTLYVPAHAKPFVAAETGAVSLDKIVIPVPDAQFAAAALSFCRRLLAIFPLANPVIVGLHCGEAFPALPQELVEDLQLQTMVVDEPIVPAIARVAKEIDADLIVMATQGRNTISKKIVGSNTEQVLHQAPCPVLSIPVW